jgi:hypothetical protein
VNFCDVQQKLEELTKGVIALDGSRGKNDSVPGVMVRCVMEMLLTAKRGKNSGLQLDGKIHLSVPMKIPRHATARI